MLGSPTLLPALLALLGDKVDKGPLPVVRRLRRPAGQSRVLGAILDRVLARPTVSAVAAGLALVMLASPVFRLHTATPVPATCRRTRLPCRPITGSSVRSRVAEHRRSSSSRRAA